MTDYSVLSRSSLERTARADENPPPQQPGRITVRHHGGGNRTKYRVIDFKRESGYARRCQDAGVRPNRSAHIALVQYEDGESATSLLRKA
ncbi:MAG: hypothetical protein ACLRRT_14920 [Ruthenibacterium lactatiformans]